MIKKSRMIVAGGLAIVVATAGIAVAGETGADLNDANVVSKVTPSKLSKKKFSKVNVLLGVVNGIDTAGNAASNAAAERIAWSKNIKIDLKKAPRCTAALPNGSTPQFAKSECPPKSFLGSGDASVHTVGSTLVAEPVVSVFNGPGPGQLRLHTYSDDLDEASPIVNARIVKATRAEQRQGFGQALVVPNAPETGPLKITSFNAKILKSKNVASAKCKPKRFKMKRTVTYTDDSRESVSKTQKCTVRR